MKKIFFLTGLILFLSVGLFYKSESKLLASNELAAHFYSKELCSCLWVLELSEIDCEEEAKEFIPRGKVEIDFKNKRVISSGYGAKQTAQFLNEKEGCVYLK
jgi:hypothetical protein